MAITYDFSGTGYTLTFENKLTPCKAKACDAGTPATKVLMLYDDVIKCPDLKWDYVFNDDGTFATGTKDSTTGVVTLGTGAGATYVVYAYKKFKNTYRSIPAYRTFNGKKLEIGDKIIFNTSYKDEVVFYSKVAEAYGSKTTDGLNYVGGDVELVIAAASTDDDGGEG